MADKAKQGVGALMQIAWNYQQAAKLVFSAGYGNQIDTNSALSSFADAVELIVVKHLNEVQVSWQSPDPSLRDWDNEHSKLVFAYGNIQIAVRLQILKDRTLDTKVRKIMSKVVEVNGFEYILPIEPNVEVRVMFTPFKPVSYSNTEHGNDIGQDVTEVAEGVYLQHWHDYSTVSHLQRDDQTGEQWDEWLPLAEDVYTLVVTQPEVVGRSLTEFAPYVQAQFRLAKIVREATGQRMSIHWRVHIVDVLPEIEHRSASTPANTSNVSWGGQKISELIVLMTVDGWTGGRSETKRDLHVLRSAWLDLLYQ